MPPQDPLYVVDGIPFGRYEFYQSADIESMTVLKMLQPEPFMGRGANGVIITTKQGKEGKTKVSWRSTAGWSSRS